jgi:hypothetical protein
MVLFTSASRMGCPPKRGKGDAANPIQHTFRELKNLRPPSVPRRHAHDANDRLRREREDAAGRMSWIWRSLSHAKARKTRRRRSV